MVCIISRLIAQDPRGSARTGTFEFNSTTSCSRSLHRLNGLFGRFKVQGSKFKVGPDFGALGEVWSDELRMHAAAQAAVGAGDAVFSADEFSERDDAIG